MSRYQQLVRLESRNSYWTKCLSPSARGMHAVYVYVYSLTGGPPFCSAREGSRRPLVLSMCGCCVCVQAVICVTGHVYMDICGVHVCLVCVTAENIPAALLPLGPGEIE